MDEAQRQTLVMGISKVPIPSHLCAFEFIQRDFCTTQSDGGKEGAFSNINIFLFIPGT